MILRSSPPSPFGRKVKIALAALGLAERVRIETTDTTDPADSIRSQNPLGKIPALILEDGAALYDSRVILEYLDWLAGGGKLIPAPGPARFAVLRAQALADGVMDAAVLRVYETRFRDEARRDAKWLGHQGEKIERALAVLESSATPYASGARPDVGEIATACALGYLDLRFGGEWRGGHPRLVAWLEGFASAVPSFEATKVKG